MRHILVIPDGNRRYAEKYGRDYLAAYKKASEVTTAMVKYVLIERKIPAFSVYALSLDNLKKRDPEELKPVLDVQTQTYWKWYFDPEIIRSGIKFSFIGDTSLLPADYRKAAMALESLPASRYGRECNLLIPYDGQADVLHAAKKCAELGCSTVEEFYQHLLLKRPVDMVVRTGCEKRLSGAPLFQSSYAELFFEKFYYPEFTTQHMAALIGEFHSRERRFGV